jgi:hypothetical protein
MNDCGSELTVKKRDKGIRSEPESEQVGNLVSQISKLDGGN